MNWTELISASQLDQIDRESEMQKILILKHSTRCSISNTALNRLEREWQDEHLKVVKPYYLDLLNHRDISNAIAERYGIRHESPQVLLISKGTCIFSQSHTQIRLHDILEKSR